MVSNISDYLRSQFSTAFRMTSISEWEIVPESDQISEVHNGALVPWVPMAITISRNSRVQDTLPGAGRPLRLGKASFQEWTEPGEPPFGIHVSALRTAPGSPGPFGLAMASVQQGEKQLFEKFWRGTFKAVATPRPESIIVASITARKPLPRKERSKKLGAPYGNKEVLDKLFALFHPSATVVHERECSSGCMPTSTARFYFGASQGVEGGQGVSCTQGVISGFVFCQQDVRRLKEPDLLLWALEFRARVMHASFIVPGALERFAEQGGSREGPLFLGHLLDEEEEEARPTATRLSAIWSPSPPSFLRHQEKSVMNPWPPPKGVGNLARTHGSSLARTHESNLARTHGSNLARTHESNLARTHGSNLARTHESNLARTHGSNLARTHESNLARTHGSNLARTHESNLARTHGSNLARTHESNLARTHGSNLARTHESNLARTHGSNLARTHESNLARTHGSNLARTHESNLARTHGSSLARTRGSSLARTRAPEETQAQTEQKLKLELRCSNSQILSLLLNHYIFFKQVLLRKVTLG
ncbi:hypothetical protein M91_12412 [Bos mutus]|uniref:Uncharacterized protein n=1 Tax=Bos mutus TaxID=72004 RepID=L8IZF1_9CETA|nr:hypothetical protein M91_12412 [Bos mutus]